MLGRAGKGSDGTGPDGTCRHGGAGGGSGAYTEILIANPSLLYSYSVGVAGAGGLSTPATGTNGGDTTFGTYTAGGGVGGTFMAAGTTTAIVLGGAGGAVSGSPDIPSSGQPGGDGVRSVTTLTIQAGAGGSTMFGGGGLPPSADGNGNAGTGLGAGGSGGFAPATTNRAGGAGTVGWIEVLEFS